MKISTNGPTAILASVLCALASVSTNAYGTPAFAETPADTRPSAPVVFLHGICSDARTWDKVKTDLILEGWAFGGELALPGDLTGEQRKWGKKADFYIVTFQDQAIEQGIGFWSLQLGTFLKSINDYRVSNGQGSTKFTIVAHSAGGLAARYYVQNYSDQSVAHLITYGTPHQGAPDASFKMLLKHMIEVLKRGFPAGSACLDAEAVAYGKGVADMRPGGSFLNELNARTFPQDVQHTSLIGDFSALELCYGGDCIVPTNSQDIRRVPNPPRADLVAARTVFGQNHITETSDTESILWAIGRLAGAPGPPRNFMASPGSSTVSLSWDPPASGEVTSYIIEAGTNVGLTDIVSVDLGSTRTQYFATSVAGGTYFARMRAKNQNGVGAPSNEVSFTLGSSVPTPAPVPSPTPTPVPTPTPSPSPTPTPSRLVGTWINLDPLIRIYGGIQRVAIRNQGDTFFVNLWGVCAESFNGCPDGEVSATGASTGPLSARWNLAWGIQTATFTLTSSGSLSVALHGHRTDGGGPDFDFSAILIK